jgi:DNA-binding winged helix-turn-helix (wHTH) protein
MNKAFKRPAAPDAPSGSGGLAPALSSSGRCFVIHAEGAAHDDRERVVHSVVERIESVLNRLGEPGVIEVGELRIELDAHRVTVGGDEVSLTVLEFKLLVMLASRRGRVHDRTALLAGVWGVHVTTRAVDVQVKRLRDKMGSARRFIQSVRGVGYMFSERPRVSPQGRRQVKAL